MEIGALFGRHKCVFCFTITLMLNINASHTITENLSLAMLEYHQCQLETFSSLTFESRQRLEAEIGNINPTNVVLKMTRSKNNWSAVKNFAKHVLRTKKLDLDVAG